MKNLMLLLGAIALFLSGCASPAGNYAAFISKLPAVTATDITQSTTTPVYSHTESASGIFTDPVSGVLTVTNGKATITIPEIGFVDSISVSGLKMQATPEQLAAARAIAAAAQPTSH